jgi:hypothetical protein
MLYAEYEEENEATTSYTPPVLKQRATAGKDYTAPSPKVIPVPREKPRKHPLFSVGVGMCLVVGLLFLWNMVLVPWWQSVQLQWHYGDSDHRVSLMGADVGHGGVSRFLAFDGQQEIVVIEVVNKSYSVYTIPATLAPGKLVTLSLTDGKEAGKPNLVVHVEGEEGVFVLFNTGSGFAWSNG